MVTWYGFVPHCKKWIKEYWIERFNMTFKNVKKCECEFKIKHKESLHIHPSQGLMIKCLTIQIKLEFRNVGFWGEGETRVPGDKPLGAEKRTNNKLNSHMARSPGIKPRTNWWEVCALTTAPTLLLKQTSFFLSLKDPHFICNKYCGEISLAKKLCFYVFWGWEWKDGDYSPV